MKRITGISFLLFWSILLNGAIRPAGLLRNIRYYNYPEYTRVVLDLSRPIQIKEKVLPGKPFTRMYFDLNQCHLDSSYPSEKSHEIIIENGNLKRIRLGRRGPSTLRVVFDFLHIGRYNHFSLKAPDRIVFDIFQEKQDMELPGTPAETIDGKYSLARQLGLGVHHIVIDPGHGGKDPGTANQRLKIQEKKIALDIAKRLRQLLVHKAGFNVTMTREDDHYLSLEERTAIANSKKGDLFVSIHLNAAPNRKARGVETYFLSFTEDPWATRVAALENAVSTKSIAELKSLIHQIMQNSKLVESKVLAGCIQQRLTESLKKKYGKIVDLGVKKAPFFVLAGSDMPSVLVEASFMSHKEEARRLQSPLYRKQIADGLYQGILDYTHSLGKREPTANQSKTTSPHPSQ